MVGFRKNMRPKPSKWLCVLTLFLCACAQIPEYCEEGKPFDPTTQFCVAGSIYEKCGGSTYTPGSQRCGAGQKIENRCSDSVYITQGTPCPQITPAPAAYTLSLNAHPENCGISLTGAGTYNANANANISVAAAPGCFFSGWTPQAGVANPSVKNTAVSMSQNRVLTANFTGNPVSGGNVDIEMVFVGRGTFTMGCTPEQGSDCWEWEKPSHQVNVGDFKIGKYPVTQAQWAAVMGSNPASFAEVTSRPVENVSWNDVQTFIANLNHITGKEYRLPTEAEWEYAARGGDGSINDKYAGGGVIDTVAWYWDNSSNGTQSAGSKAPNELGIYDMSGNVWEWVNDWYGSYTASAKDNPKGPANGTNRVVRGGSWNNAARSCRVSGRDSSPPGNRNYYTGFRLALTP